MAETPSRPNVLVIVADDLGYADVGFNGGQAFATPNLDRLAATGIKLTDFRACPMCSPTRAGLLTGRWPIRYGLMRSVVPPWSTNGLPAAEKTLAEFFGAAGYEHRAIIGKWHLGHARKEFLPLAQGFTRFYGHYNGAIDYFTHEREGERDWHDNEKSVDEPGYSTDLLAREASSFVANAPDGKPWLLYLPFNAPHSPFQAKEIDLQKYNQFKMPDRRAYAAMIDCMDQGIGKVLNAVDTRKDATNTLVLFFSDNGGIPRVGSSNGPWRGAKLSVYEGGTRVCAAIRWPAGGLTGGKTFSGRIGYVDVLPSLLAAAGMPAPENLDGVNFLPALTGRKPLDTRKWFSYMHQAEDAHASVHEGNLKLVAHGDFFSAHPAVAPRFELYNLESDSGEKDDISGKMGDAVKRLHASLIEFGKLRSSEGENYEAGLSGFKAPKNWVITE